MRFFKRKLREQEEQINQEEQTAEESEPAEKGIFDRFEFRSIKQNETAQAVAIEQACFPSSEACSEKHMSERIIVAADLFLVAVDKETGKLAGFLNGLATNEYFFSDDFFTNAGLNENGGNNIMILGLAVLPEYRMQGLASALMSEYMRREREKGRQMLILTCLDSRVEMYKKMGFTCHGRAASVWGGEQWYEMSCTL